VGKLWAEKLRNHHFDYQLWQKIILFCPFKQALGPKQHSIQWVNWLGDEMTKQLQLVSRIKYMQLYPCAPIYLQYHDKGLHLELRD